MDSSIIFFASQISQSSDIKKNERLIIEFITNLNLRFSNDEYKSKLKDLLTCLEKPKGNSATARNAYDNAEKIITGYLK